MRETFVQHPPYYHVGIVVPDLAKAIARFSDVLGIKFAQPATFHIPRLEDPNPHSAELVAAFSMTAPPYVELIQAAGDGIISVANAGRILYFAVWESDMAKRLEILRRQNVGLAALMRMDASSPPFAMITKPDLMGARIEYVGDAARPAIEEWVRTGVFPGGIGAAH
jgi:catechol 2,3-dioxygenase-like lactoylglutathione lyase family enzyme